jgi:nucleoside 2-deoxyribosyltransferase
MTRDARGREEELYRQIVEGDKKDIDASDCVLVMATKPGWGTAMEVLYAYGRGKPVVCITGENPSPWIRYHSVYMVPSLEAGLAAILSL